MDRNEELKKTINAELINLDRLVLELKGLLAGTGEKKTSYEVRAAGSILHDFYCGIEKIFERIALKIDGKVPYGKNSHKELLMQMGETLEENRGPIISEELMIKLKEFLRFRHLFRNIYGFELKWGRAEPLFNQIEQVLTDLKKDIDIFWGRV